MTAYPDPFEAQAREIVYSLSCCSTGCDGYVHQDDQHKAIAALLSLHRAEVGLVRIDELERIHPTLHWVELEKYKNDRIKELKNVSNS